MTTNEIPCAICANVGRLTLGDVTYCRQCKHAFCDKHIVEHACEEFEYATRERKR
jgi:hypothetical protein